MGTLIAVPAFESLAPTGVARAAGAGSGTAGLLPLRMAFVYSPNGKNMAHWKPTQDGANYELTRALTPLEKFRNDFQVITGLALDGARSHGDGGGDHARANVAFLTGCHPRKTAGADIKAGISVDQIAANHTGHFTRMASLEVSCDEPRRAGNCDSGYSCAYQFNLAWKSENMPMTPERDPKEVFDRMFGNAVTSEENESRVKRERFNKSILDFVMDDTKSLQRHLGRRDREKLDEYLTSLRQVEKRIADAQQSAKKLPPGARAEFLRVTRNTSGSCTT
jgi:hypothetical protein